MSNFGPVLHSSQGDEPLDFNNVQLGDTRDMAVKTLPYERQFNPYDFNGGTNVVLAGEDYAIAAGCTRMSTGYEILSNVWLTIFVCISVFLRNWPSDFLRFVKFFFLNNFCFVQFS